MRQLKVSLRSHAVRGGLVPKGSHQLELARVKWLVDFGLWRHDRDRRRRRARLRYWMALATRAATPRVPLSGEHTSPAPAPRAVAQALAELTNVESQIEHDLHPCWIGKDCARSF